MRLSAVRFLLALASWSLSTVPVWACVIPRDIAAERTQWERIEGEYHQTSSFDVPKLHISEKTWIYKSSGDWEEGGPFQLRWVVTWRFGHIVDREGNRIETYHRTSDFETTCGEAEGPEGDEKGAFYIQINPTDDRYYIHDWADPSEGPADQHN